jgi:hypothetical protein
LVAVDTYRALPEDERLAISKEMACHPGMWFGDRTRPDDAATQPAHAAMLTRSLIQRRHIVGRIDRGEHDAVSRAALNELADGLPDQTSYELTGRPRAQQGQRIRQRQDTSLQQGCLSATSRPHGQREGIILPPLGQYGSV